jgi:hypothetical protein
MATLAEKASSASATWSPMARTLRPWSAAKRRAAGAEKEGRDAVKRNAMEP